MIGVGRDLCGSSSPNPLPKQGHLQQAAQHLVQVDLEYFQRRRLHNLPGQPVPVLHHPQSEEVLCLAGTSYASVCQDVELCQGMGQDKAGPCMFTSFRLRAGTELGTSLVLQGRNIAWFVQVIEKWGFSGISASQRCWGGFRRSCNKIIVIKKEQTSFPDDQRNCSSGGYLLGGVVAVVPSGWGYRCYPSCIVCKQTTEPCACSKHQPCQLILGAENQLGFVGFIPAASL